MIVLDASVVLATFLNEPGGDVLPSMTDDFRICVFNLGEVASKLTDKGFTPEEVRAAIEPLAPSSIPLSVDRATQAGLWRRDTRRFGLSMGDRCCLALALELGAEVYTADRVWSQLDLGVKVRVIR
ncbi:MAG: type II toxin-antitoxin system VapC family toxin [Paracoccaceae bacterium]